MNKGLEKWFSQKNKKELIAIILEMRDHNNKLKDDIDLLLEEEE